MKKIIASLFTVIFILLALNANALEMKQKDIKSLLTAVEVPTSRGISCEDPAITSDKSISYGARVKIERN